MCFLLNASETTALPHTHAHTNPNPSAPRAACITLGFQGQRYLNDIFEKDLRCQAMRHHPNGLGSGVSSQLGGFSNSWRYPTCFGLFVGVFLYRKNNSLLANSGKSHPPRWSHLPSLEVLERRMESWGIHPEEDGNFLELHQWLPKATNQKVESQLPIFPRFLGDPQMWVETICLLPFFGLVAQKATAIFTMWYICIHNISIYTHYTSYHINFLERELVLSPKFRRIHHVRFIRR